MPYMHTCVVKRLDQMECKSALRYTYMEKQIEKFAKYKHSYCEAKEGNINKHSFMCHYFSFVKVQAHFT